MQMLFKFLRSIFLIICLIIIYFNFSNLLLFTNIFLNNNCEYCQIEIKNSVGGWNDNKTESLKILENNLGENFNEEDYKSYFYILFTCNNYTKCEINNESQQIRKKCIEKNLNYCFFDFEQRSKLMTKNNNFNTYCINSMIRIENRDILCKNYFLRDKENYEETR